MSADPAPRHANAFTLVATIAALLVCVRHSGVLLGPSQPTTWVGQTPSTGLALLLATSGWLLVAAWDRDPRIGPFALRRVMRIWPSLLIVLLASALVLGPVVSALPWREYLAHPGVARYVVENLMLRTSYSLPGVFAENPYPNAVNGTLWSLSAQVACFAMVPVVGLLRSSWRWIAWASLAVIALVVFASSLAEGIVVWATSVQAAMLPIEAFAIGAALGASHRRVPWWVGALALVTFVASPSLPLGGLRDVLQIALLAVAAVGLGSIDHPVVRRVSPRRNLSLGIFLLGFPVQQMLIWAAPTLPALASMAIALVVALVGAMLLDVVVDRPVQRLLRRVVPAPGRERSRGVPFPSARTPIA